MKTASDNIDNIFEMVLVAAKRARRVAHGAEPMVDLENDKPTVVALREIADGHVTPAILEEIDQPPSEEFHAPPRRPKTSSLFVAFSIGRLEHDFFNPKQART